ncbi:MAG: alpha/beta fold hydrolase [Planctomycetaceae bacterium]
MVAPGGCGGAYARLRPEAEVRALARLVGAYEALPGTGLLVAAGVADDAPVRIAARHVRAADTERLVVFVHGVLSDSRTWRFLGGELGRDHSLLLVDLPGCGGSDAPDPGGAGKGFTSPTVLARIDRAVLISTPDFALERQHATFKEVADASALKIGLGAALGVLRARTAGTVSTGTGDETLALREEADRLLEVPKDARRRRPAQAMLREAAFREDDRSDWPAIERLVADYARVQVPVLLIAGARDEFVPAAMSYKPSILLPDARLRILPGLMHSPQVEAPALSGGLIREFLGKGGEGAAQGAEARAP